MCDKLITRCSLNLAESKHWHDSLLLWLSQLWIVVKAKRAKLLCLPSPRNWLDVVQHSDQSPGQQLLTRLSLSQNGRICVIVFCVRCCCCCFSAKSTMVGCYLIAWLAPASVSLSFLPCFRFSYFLASSVLALTYDNFMTLIATNVLVSGHSLSVYLYLCIFISPASTFRAREPHKSKV